MASSSSNVGRYGARRSHQSVDAADAVSSGQMYYDQSYNQDYDRRSNQRYDRDYSHAAEVYEPGQENATHRRGSFRGQNNYRGQTRAQGQHGRKFAAERNSASGEFALEEDTFCDNDVTRPHFDRQAEQKTRNYTPRGYGGKERSTAYQENFRDDWRHEDNGTRRGSTRRQRGGANNDQVNRSHAGDEHRTSENHPNPNHPERNWRKAGVRNSGGKYPEDSSGSNETNVVGADMKISSENDENCGKEARSGDSQRYGNKNERAKGGDFRDGEEYKSRRTEPDRNGNRQNRSGQGSRNAEVVPQREMAKYGSQPAAELDRPSRDLHRVPDEYSDTGDLRTSLAREESVASSVESRAVGARKKSGNWRDDIPGGRVENCEDGDLGSRGRHRGRRNRKGPLEDRQHDGETKNRVDSERGWQGGQSRDDLGVREGQTGWNRDDYDGGNMEDSAPRREKNDVRRVENSRNAPRGFTKDSRRQTARGRWDDGRYSTDYNNWGGNEGKKRPQQGSDWQRKNGNDGHQDWQKPSTGNKQSVDLSREDSDKSKETSTKKTSNLDVTKSWDAEMGSSKDGDIRSSKISEAHQPKRTTRNKEDDFPKTASWQDETQRGLLIDQLCAGKYECLVCFNLVRSDTAVWSCSSCYHIYHLYCIKKWALSSAATPLPDGTGTAWRCPTCQNSYLQVPNQYICFCGKQRDPELNRYATPHSCHETCSRERNRGCPHLCTLLCHPGPCPPCSAFVTRSCDCGKTKRSVKCVGDATSFKCTESCGRTLNCGQHVCEELCHSGSCTACAVNLERGCYCGRETRTVRCGSGEAFVAGFTCGGKCGRRLGCGRHDCEEDCHPGPCVDCPRRPSVVTMCACGKTPLVEIPGAKPRETCDDPIATCKEVCDKELACGNEGSRHRCQHKCHEGPCSTTCDRMTEVTCRCGAVTKEMSCLESLELTDSTPFVCDRRCKKKLSCGRHRCNQTCCTSDEHLCQINCGYKLSCGLHRCEEPCHKGNCPSCWQVSFDELRCYCGAQVIYPPVACGTKPPECNRPCTRQHTCNHPATHHCHSEEVCPPCTVLTEKWCLGRHELRSNIPCYVAEISCGMKCGKELPCLVHKCQQSCHKGPCLAGKVCTQPCPMIRSECGHPCQAPCHPDAPCPATVCRAEVTLQCDCGRRKEKGQCLRGHDTASSQSDYSKMTAQLVASKLWEGQSIDLAVLCKELGNKKTRKLQCNSECSIQERNQRLALALEIKNPDLSGKLGNPTYSPFLKDFAKQNLTFVASVEKALSDLVTASQQPRVARKIHSFKVMPSNQRRVVHELAEFYGCQTESYDEEPNKNVVATAVKDKCWLPSVTLTALVQRELFPKAPLPIPINCKEDQIRSAAQAAKHSTQVFALPSSTSNSSSSNRASASGQASGSGSSSNRRNHEPKIDYFDFTD